MTAGGTVGRCRCGARLARDNPSRLCGACTLSSRTLSARPPAVPAGFWDEPTMRTALAERDMGAVMRAYRTHPYHGRDIPQLVAAVWVGITQARLSRIENGQPVNSMTKLIHWAGVLGIPPGLLWFAMPASASAQFDHRPARHRAPENLEAACARLPDTDGLDDVNRRELLRLVSVAGAAMALTSAAELDWDRLSITAGRVDAATLDEYAALNSHLWQVFALSKSKAAVFPLVRQHLDVLADRLRQPGDQFSRARLCALTSDLLQLAGEILFDGNAYTDAGHCYTLAASAAKEAGAYDLWACAMTRHAFIGVYEHDGRSALSMSELAGRLADRGDRQLATRQWVAVVHAQALAGIGELDACQRALDAAETVRELTGTVRTHGWLRFDGSRLAEERGACFAELRRPDLAQTALAEALRQPISARRRGGVLADLAVTGAQQRDVDQVVTYAGSAVELARQTGSGYIGRKLAALRPHLAALGNDARVRQLNEQLSQVVGTTV